MVLDTEASPDREYLSQVAWVIYSSGGVPLSAYCASIVAPDWARTERASSLTEAGSAPAPLTTRKTTLKCVLEDLATDVRRHSPLSLAAHNVEWDAAVIREAERQSGIASGVCALPRFCTMLLAATHENGLGQYMTLGKLFESLFGKEHENAHDALADATACGRCFWHLVKEGRLKGHVHADAVSRASPAGRRRALFELELNCLRILRSARAQRSTREHAFQASQRVGGIDELVLDRIRRLPPAQFQSFLDSYTAKHSLSSARYIKKVLAFERREVVLKPETSWRCVVAYCSVAEKGERRELAGLLLSRRPKGYKEIKLELGQHDAVVIQEIRGLLAIPDFAKMELLELCGGISELASEVEADYSSGRTQKWDNPSVLLNRFALGDKTVCGTHQFNLPYGALVLSIRPPSIIRRLLSIFGS